MNRQLYNILALLFLATGCSPSLAPLKTVEKVDLPRFMGDWYVIATIPTFIEKGAHKRG
jgi:apolipoprotein D and lipocalin family protein